MKILLILDRKEKYASKYLTVTTLERGVQIVTLNYLESYKEYSPYTLINTEVDFISKVVNM
ncbi:MULTISPECIES: DUF6718 family protein [Clostridium]|uniref:DUF6718 family protein n=1 Tax=Clostridium TaxID=1485 RepID=UPI001EEE8561|nr:DUF6718 family protein [Clostridium sp. YIM B02555]